MRETIKKHSDFMMAEDDPKFVSPLFIMRARKTKWPDEAKYGLVATKKTFRHAVDRNRAKRLLRVWIRAAGAELSPEMDYVFIARHPILEAALPDGVEMVKKALRKIRNKEQERGKNSPFLVPVPRS